MLFRDQRHFFSPQECRNLSFHLEIRFIRLSAFETMNFDANTCKSSEKTSMPLKTMNFEFWCIKWLNCCNLPSYARLEHALMLLHSAASPAAIAFVKSSSRSWENGDFAVINESQTITTRKLSNFLTIPKWLTSLIAPSMKLLMVRVSCKGEFVVCLLARRGHLNWDIKFFTRFWSDSSKNQVQGWTCSIDKQTGCAVAGKWIVAIKTSRKIKFQSIFSPRQNLWVVRRLGYETDCRRTWNWLHFFKIFLNYSITLQELKQSRRE